MKKSAYQKTGIAVVVPTFNEADNIASLVREIRNNINYGDKIIIVDDNSPDGTAKIAEKLAEKYNNVFLIQRKGKSGRGSAVFEGFKFARKFSSSYYLEMDADFSHRPGDIPRLLKAVKNRDIVIGSRYLAKSRIFNWSIRRRVFSKLANIYAKVMLGVPISDYTNGFRIYSNDAIEFLFSQKLKSRGYILLSETAYKLHRSGFKFGEISIVFVNRKRGASNLDFSEIKNSFFSIWLIRFSS